MKDFKGRVIKLITFLPQVAAVTPSKMCILQLRQQIKKERKPHLNVLEITDGKTA